MPLKTFLTTPLLVCPCLVSLCSKYFASYRHYSSSTGSVSTHPSTTVISLSFASYRLATNFAHIETDLLPSPDTLSQAQSLTPDIHWDTVFQSFVCGVLITASVSTRTSLTFDPPLQLPSDFVQGSIHTQYKHPYKDLSPFPLVGSFGPIEPPTC